MSESTLKAILMLNNCSACYASFLVSHKQSQIIVISRGNDSISINVCSQNCTYCKSLIVFISILVSARCEVFLDNESRI